MLIGKKLKSLRERHKMSLTDLAAKSGVQIATLSRIENLKMTGTLDSHMNIARALGVELVDLYQTEEAETAKPEAPQVHKATAESFTYNDRASYEILTTNLLKKKMMPVILRIEPGGATNPETSAADAERFVFVLEGQVDIYIEKELYHLKTNSSLYFDASRSHRFVNTGTKTAKIISVLTPVVL